MMAVRSLLFLLFQIVLTPPFATLVLVTFPLPRLWRYKFILIWPWSVIQVGRLLCGMRYQVSGRENIPAGPHILMGKHSSTWETLAFPFLFPPLAYVAKRELLWIPFFGWAFTLASPIIINRQAGKEAMEQVVEQGRERLQQGFWISIYPEGTRISAGTRGKYKTGGARLAITLGVPILPVAHNAGYLWPKGTYLRKPGLITVSIGKSIPTLGREMIELMTEVENWIETEVARMGRADTEK